MSTTTERFGHPDDGWPTAPDITRATLPTGEQFDALRELIRGTAPDPDGRQQPGGPVWRQT